MGDQALVHILPSPSGNTEFKKYLNLLLALRARVSKTLVCEHGPIDLTVDFTTFCQLHCVFCAVGNGTISRGCNAMAVERYEKLLAETGDYLFLTWNFSAGEPLLHQQAAELLSLGRKHDIFSIVSTNLSMPLSSARIDALLRSGVGMISASLDGSNTEAYRRYRAGGRFDLVLENLRTLARRKRELGLAFPVLEWRYLVFEHNQDGVGEARRLAEEIQVDLLEFFPGYALADAQGPDAVRPMTCAMPVPTISGPALEKGLARTDGALRRNLLGKQKQCGAFLESNPLCDWLYFSGMVYPDGALSPCCVATNQEDDFSSLNDLSFAQGWNSSAHQAARRFSRDGSPSGTVCDRCPAPPARRLQFVERLRAILWNSPDWALRLLAAAPHEFFLPDDEHYLPLEIKAIRQNALVSSAPDRETARRLRSMGETVVMPNDMKRLIQLAEEG